MKIEILQENLVKALAKAGRIVSAKAQLPVLQHVLLETKDGRLTIHTTNLETTETIWVGAKIFQEGSLCVPCRLLTEFVSSIPQLTLTLQEAAGSLHITGQGVDAMIPGIAAAEFPPLPEIKKETKTPLNKDVFAKALRMVLFASANDESRPILTGIKMKTEGDMVIFAATDGYRLSVQKVSLALKEDVDIVIPTHALAEVLKASQENKDQEEMFLGQTSDGQIAFILNDTEIYTRLIDGEFPEYGKIIPKTHTTESIIDREALARAVKSAALFARENANIIKLKITETGMEISANTPQVGENRIEIEAQTTGEGGEIAFNSRFLVDFLANFTEDTVLFEMTGSLNPGVFKSQTEEFFLHIIMPVRVQK